MTSPPAAQPEPQSPLPPARAKVQLTAVQRTLLATLHARARDYASPNSQLRDEWAVATLARLDDDLAPEARLDRDGALVVLLALAGRGAVMRAALLDRWVAAFLAEHPAGVTVVHLACGLDSRAWRLRPRGPRVLWIDADMPPVIALRRRLFPEPPPLGPGGEYRLLTVDASSTEWLDAIPDDRPTLVIMEGLTMYLAPPTAEALLQRLVARFPEGQLLFDAFGPVFAQLMGRLAGKGPPVADGGPVGWSLTNPAALAARLGPRVALLDVQYGLAAPDVLAAPLASVVACAAAALLAFVSYVPFGPWLLAALARLPPRLSQFFILRYAF